MGRKKNKYRGYSNFRKVLSKQTPNTNRTPTIDECIQLMDRREDILAWQTKRSFKKASPKLACPSTGYWGFKRPFVKPTLAKLTGPNCRRQFGRDFVVDPPGFEPGREAWEASILTKLDHGRLAARIVS